MKTAQRIDVGDEIAALWINSGDWDKQVSRLSIIRPMAGHVNNDRQHCEQCGLSMVPLEIIHVARQCSDCEQTVYVAEPGEGGRASRS